jgi:membrane protein
MSGARQAGWKGHTMLSKVFHFLDDEIWRIRLKDLPAATRLPFRAFRVAVQSVHQFYHDQCPFKASALTYYSLLSIVPVLAVIFGAAKGFGLEQLIQAQILQLAQNAKWQSEVVDRIIAFSHSLLENARGGVIAGVGFLIAFWTVVSIMGEIENSLNQIWDVRISRSLKRRFSDYISVIVLAPFLQIISSSGAVLLAGRVKLILERNVFPGAFNPAVGFVLNFVPYVSIWILLSMLYIVMPNTKVPVKSGLLAGIITGTIFQLLQWVYIYFQIGVSSYGAIYGSFAALPLFLVWLQLSWMIVLLGAEIAVAHANDETFGYHPDFSRVSLWSRKLLLLRLFHLIVKRFCRGEDPLTAPEISNVLEIPLRLVRQLLRDLGTAGMVVETVREKTSELGFQPARSIEEATLKDVLDAYERHGMDADSLSLASDGEKLLASLKNIEDVARKAPGNVEVRNV